MVRHQLTAICFAENLPIRELVAALPDADRGPHEVRLRAREGGITYLYPFGAAAFQDVAEAEREVALSRVQAAFPRLTRVSSQEELTVVEDRQATPTLDTGVLTLDLLTPRRASVIAMTLAQSVAMTYYEELLDGMFQRTSELVGRLEKRGTARLRTRPLHRFIGEAIGVRNEVLSVLHLLDKPDEVWEDPGLETIYRDLRAELDLGDRFSSLEIELRSIQESLELVLDVVRDKRGALLEMAIVGLILFEIVLSLLRH